MGFQRIVVACPDEEYINSIEYKLTEAFGKNASFEYITDMSYFMQFMQMPQNIDILLIDRNWYQENIHKQNCKKIFFLVDNETVIQNSQVDVIYKYASIRSMIDTIDSRLLFQGTEERETMATQLISIYSPIGGSGKTTTALGVATALVQSGYKVLYFNSEFLQDYQIFFDDLAYLPDAVGYQCYMNPDAGADMMLQYKQKRGFELIPPLSKPLTSYQITFPMLVQMILHIKRMNICDYIVVELSSETTAEKMNFLMNCEKVVLVARQDEQATKKMKLFLKGVTDWKGQCVLVCNHYRSEETNALMDYEITGQYEICEYIEEQEEEITLNRMRQGDLYTKTATAVR